MYNHVNYISKKKTRLIADDVYEIIIKVLSMVNSLKFEIIFFRFCDFLYDDVKLLFYCFI
jgi:hypothetical protein